MRTTRRCCATPATPSSAATRWPASATRARRASRRCISNCAVTDTRPIRSAGCRNADTGPTARVRAAHDRARIIAARHIRRIVRQESCMRLRPWFALLLGLQLLPALAQQAPPTTPATPAAKPSTPAEGEPAEVAPADDPDAAETAATKVPLDEIRRFVGVFDAVREAYVDPVTDRK